MGRSPCCDAASLKKGPWTPEEDQKLQAYIQQYGHGRWRSLPEKAGLKRCGKSCRLRWTNYLRPDIKRGNFSFQEEQTIIQLHAFLGNRWSAIATHLPKRTDNEIKNYWNTHLRKRLAKRGIESIDPATHKPKIATLSLPRPPANGNSKNLNLSHMAQWEATRFETEKSMVKELNYRQNQRGLSGSSTSASANLLNKMATKIAPPRCLSILKAWQGILSRSTQSDSSGGSGSSSDSSGGDNNGGSSSINVESAATGLPEFRGVDLGSFDGEFGEECGMIHHQDHKVFDAADAWNFLEPLDSNEGNLEDLLNNFLLNDSDEEWNPSIDGIDCNNININGGGSDSEAIFEGNRSYWNELFNLVNFGPSNSPMF